MYGINAPEITGVNKSKGLISKSKLEYYLNSNDLRVVIRGLDKYGRALVDIFGKDSTDIEIYINSAMVQLGFAVPYVVQQ